MNVYHYYTLAPNRPFAGAMQHFHFVMPFLVNDRVLFRKGICALVSKATLISFISVIVGFWCSINGYVLITFKFDSQKFVGIFKSL